MAIDIEKFINRQKMADYTSQCIQCGECLDVCCTYYTTQEERLSPMGRIETVSDFLEKGELAPERVESIYLCTDCGRCDTVCPSEIPISSVIADSKVALVDAGAGPLEKHNKMIDAIFKHNNAVNGDNDKRLDWIPEEYRSKVKFEDDPSDTLLYIGCLSSFVDKKSAAASLDILMTAGVDFKIMKDEFCCGIYPYNAGKINEAEKIFREMHERFRKAGVKKIIVPCGGCHRTFSAYYPRLLEDFDIKVLHISEVITDLISENRIALSTASETVTFLDACKMGRKYGLYEQPREILKMCGYEIDEMEDNMENAICCGSGAGVRSIDRNLSMKIADKIISQPMASKIVSTCPFCVFNFNYTAHKKELDKKASHIAVFVQSCLKKP